jgi:hypothetical protein
MLNEEWDTLVYETRGNVHEHGAKIWDNSKGGSRGVLVARTQLDCSSPPNKVHSSEVPSAAQIVLEEGKMPASGAREGIILVPDDSEANRDLLVGEGKRLCHNCDTKPVFPGKTDFFDRSCLLILRNLLKLRECPDNPAYMARPLFFIFLGSSAQSTAALSTLGR